MRIKIKFTPNTQPVPNNLSVVNSYIHKCLGNNNPYHDAQSNYSISRLLGGKIIDNGRNFNFPNGGYIIISSFDEDFINNIIMGCLNNDSLGYGMNFDGIDHIKENFYNGWNYFKTTDMGFILRKPQNTVYDENDIHKGYYTLNDSNFIDVLKTHIINKFTKINPKLDFSGFNLVIDDHPNHQVKYRYSKHIKNSVNICQINIFTNKKVAETIYNYGLGQSCGSGFGCVFTTQFMDKYK